MCGRYVSTRQPDDLATLFHAEVPPAEQALPPSWNIAPTQDVRAVIERVDRDTGEIRRTLRAVRWGLVPSWAKDPAIGTKMINARVETVHEKPAYRRPFAKRRCLLPADGFYEWDRVPARDGRKAYRQPYYIHPEDDGVMALAGLYEFWKHPDSDDGESWLITCTIITTEATDAAGRVHPRMPLTIAEKDADAWLDPAVEDPDRIRKLLADPTARPLDARPVSTQVNRPGPDSPGLLDAVDLP
ncbi:Putative SOS response-associated peptidase YedK [Actinacidiphila alni]|uniref:Abasic site processing protein n=1 Tax=Actinacidiphila alni TaxID=380248 RepID=A0A1I2MPF5_9ACTN|nr:SOS response-associated peptidase [Actinacidiphila alni]SFF91011.1 Putative SOS response-associated peptidase YedK [Actinacidiphila alni]